MVEYVKLSCTSCGGRLELSSDIDRFACSHCGTELMVKRSHGVVALGEVAEDIENIKQSSDKTASELAIVRLKGEISSLEAKKRGIEISISQQQDASKAFHLFRNQDSQVKLRISKNLGILRSIQKLTTQDLIRFNEFLASKHPKFWNVHVHVGDLVGLSSEIAAKTDRLAFHQSVVTAS